LSLALLTGGNEESLGRKTKDLSRESMRHQEFPGTSDPAYASGIIKALHFVLTRLTTITTPHDY
jgi:hypothetical protein